ncbi:MAG TPA: hypothetical protein VKT77_08295 [Chthonomonadaceae bacterium]|nr:hypothetical protein [Chthonomonadaceae bacterium]
MAEERDRDGSGFWDRLRSKVTSVASRVVAGPGAAIVKGKTAARDVFDEGGLIVGAGHPIDDAAIDRAAAAGQMPALIAAAAEAQSQDLKERLRTTYGQTPEAQERRNLADSDTYIEARGYIKCVAAVEVTDIRGGVLVPAGKVIEDEDVRCVRDAGQLAALIYSAQQSASAPRPPSPEEVAEAKRVRQDGYLPPKRRTAVPLGDTFEEK